MAFIQKKVRLTVFPVIELLSETLVKNRKNNKSK